MTDENTPPDNQEQPSGPVDDEKEAKRKAAAEARAARASARAAKTDAESDTPKAPSPKQPILDRLVGSLKRTSVPPLWSKLLSMSGTDTFPMWLYRRNFGWKRLDCCCPTRS